MGDGMSQSCHARESHVIHPLTPSQLIQLSPPAWLTPTTVVTQPYMATLVSQSVCEFGLISLAISKRQITCSRFALAGRKRIDAYPPFLIRTPSPLPPFQTQPQPTSLGTYLTTYFHVLPTYLPLAPVPFVYLSSRPCNITRLLCLCHHNICLVCVCGLPNLALDTQVGELFGR